MIHLRLLAAVAALALATAAMACDDEDDAPPPERARVVQALGGSGTLAQHA